MSAPIVGKNFTSTPITRKKPKGNTGAYRTRVLWVFWKRDNGACQICDAPAYNIHHILNKKDYWHWKKESLNMISLCFNCHNKADNGQISITYLLSKIIN